jgi:uncharacterized protein YyaL (SSP411 family)
MATNRLAQEKSPYLLQHAHNPVDWYPWGEEAFIRARDEGKPIFLSVGYSTCHWCHVMERESFENDETAKLLNGYFVSIKVDREERPDIDAIYMSALQAMVGSGGWPMSIFLTPDLKPFFAGTYFPPFPAHGRPSFPQLLTRIHELWQSDRAALVESADHITDAIRPADHVREAEGRLSDEVLRGAIGTTYQYFERSFDRAEGGFGGAPKFPRPVQFDFLLNYYSAYKEERACEMALYTLRKMAMGGMHDHLGGGFHRYSVDRFWRVSHFEKMLYDQAQLVHSYLDAYQLKHDEFEAGVARSTIEYVLRDLTHSEGGFFSAEDADSEGEEGKFYVWTLDVLETILGKEEAELSAFRYGVTAEGNFEHGKNVLYLAHPLDEVAIRFGISLDECKRRLGESCNKLIATRNERVRPSLDDKVLTSWNGLMLGAIARAGDVLQEPRYLEVATKAGEFVWKNLRRADLLLRTWRNGDAGIPAFLDDYAFLIKGYLELYEATFEAVWLERAIQLQKEQDRDLYDSSSAGYFMSREAPDVLVRSKSDYDGAEPSGNSISVLNLLKLAILTENDSYRQRAEETLHYFALKIQGYPYAMPEMMVGAIWLEQMPAQIVYAGKDIQSLKRETNSRFLPRSVHMSSESTRAPFAKSLSAIDGKPTAYVCKNFACELPVTTSAELSRVLDSV